jgi:NTE family protein
MRPPLLSDWLREGPVTLAMSAGFFGFFAHAGVLTVLEDEGLLPERVAGASAGALVTGAWAAGLDAPRIAEELLRVRREDFWDPRPGAGLLRGARFRARLEEILPVKTFGECRAPAAVSVYDLVARRVRALGRGADIARAIHASCAVPFMFHPVWIDGRPHVDGGVTDRAGLAGVPDGGRVLLHFLTSRSPWRRPASPLLRVPRRDGLAAIVLEGLPRVGPFRLAMGRRAFELGRQGMRRALGQPIEDGTVSVLTS